MNQTQGFALLAWNFNKHKVLAVVMIVTIGSCETNYKFFGPFHSLKIEKLNLTRTWLLIVNHK